MLRDPRLSAWLLATIGALGCGPRAGGGGSGGAGNAGTGGAAGTTGSGGAGDVDGGRRDAPADAGAAGSGGDRTRRERPPGVGLRLGRRERFSGRRAGRTHGNPGWRHGGRRAAEDSFRPTVRPGSPYLALARGKKLYDKRETEKKRSWQRERGRLLRQKG